MASIKELGNGKYRVFVCNGIKPDGKLNRSSKVIEAKSMADAKRQAQALEVDFKRGNEIQFSKAPTFSELVTKWRELKADEVGDKTREAYEVYLKHFMLPYFGRMRVRDIKAIDIETYLKSLTKDGVRVDGKSGGYSDKTIHNHFMFIQTLLKYAVKWEIIEYNPCVRVDRPKRTKKEVAYYEDTDIAKLFACLEQEAEEIVSKFSRKYDLLPTYEAYCRKQVRIFRDLMYKIYVWMALTSACRRSELVGLKIDSCDFENNRIMITKTGHYSSGKGIYFKDILKNGEPSKHVDMPVTMMEMLKDYLAERSRIIDLMDWEDSGYVFISLEEGNVVYPGGPMLPDTISNWFSNLLEKYNLPKITLHGMRHSSISYLINAGVPVKMVAERAGHKNTRTTEEIYSHVYAKKKRETADVYNGLFDGFAKDKEDIEK